LIRVLRGHKESIIALDLYPSCKYIASAGMDNVIYLWNLTKKSAPLKLIGHKVFIE
jgi:WD40 repeat protein